MGLVLFRVNLISPETTSVTFQAMCVLLTSAVSAVVVSVLLPPLYITT